MYVRMFLDQSIFDFKFDWSFSFEFASFPYNNILMYLVGKKFKEEDVFINLEILFLGREKWDWNGITLREREKK